MQINTLKLIAVLMLSIGTGLILLRIIKHYMGVDCAEDVSISFSVSTWHIGLIFLFCSILLITLRFPKELILTRVAVSLMLLFGVALVGVYLIVIESTNVKITPPQITIWFLGYLSTVCGLMLLGDLHKLKKIMKNKGEEL